MESGLCYARMADVNVWEQSLRKKVPLAAALLIFSCAGTALGGEDMLEQQVSLAITPTCSLSKPATGGDFIFPTIDGLYSGPLTTIATLNYQCTPGVDPSISLSDGGGSPDVFTMSGSMHPDNKIRFTISLGNGPGGERVLNSGGSRVSLPPVASAIVNSVQFFASATISPNTVPDNYTDTITATLNF